MKKDLDDYLELIQSEGIRNFVKTALAAAPPEFWIAPASSSGKYHPPEDNMEGGLVIHSRKAVRVAIALCRFFGIEDGLMKDMVIAAAVLHDIKKSGDPWDKHTHPEHGLIAYNWLMQFADNDPNLLGICQLVKDHVGIWNKPKSTPALTIGKQVDRFALCSLIVQLADYWASQKWCPFICDNFAE